MTQKPTTDMLGHHIAAGLEILQGDIDDNSDHRVVSVVSVDATDPSNLIIHTTDATGLRRAVYEVSITRIG